MICGLTLSQVRSYSQKCSSCHWRQLLEGQNYTLLFRWFGDDGDASPDTSGEREQAAEFTHPRLSQSH
jgi:hypothetical protein